jgi:putative hemolysin
VGDVVQALTRGRYRARLALSDNDRQRAQSLRHQVFRQRRGLVQGAGLDADRFDPMCQHVLIEDTATAALLGCFRVAVLADGVALQGCYSGEAYDLSPLRDLQGPMIEVGRFCLHPDHSDPDLLRLAWGAVTRLVDGAGARLLLGCSSFEGADPARHRAALALLAAAHLGPPDLRPRPKAAQTYGFAADLAGQGADPRAGLAAIPPLLRTYLGMGGWVSDHAVIDPDLDTLHVFTAVEIARIPPARARALRMIAEG